MTTPKKLPLICIHCATKYLLAITIVVFVVVLASRGC